MLWSREEVFQARFIHIPPSSSSSQDHYWLIRTSLLLVSHLGGELPRVKVLGGGGTSSSPWGRPRLIGTNQWQVFVEVQYKTAVYYLTK